MILPRDNRRPRWWPVRKAPNVHVPLGRGGPVEVRSARPREPVAISLDNERREVRRRFERSPFPLYGLPAAWQGARYLGGGEWNKHGILGLSLVHGALVEGEGPALIVEVATPGASEGGTSLRTLAASVWNGRLDNPPAGVRRSLEWVSIDESPAPLDVLAQRECWVGRAAFQGTRITVEAIQFSLDLVTLVALRGRDLDLYQTKF